jgi:hypothetical protein
MRGDLAPGQDAGRQIHPVRQSSDSGIRVGRLLGLTDCFITSLGSGDPGRTRTCNPRRGNPTWRIDSARELALMSQLRVSDCGFDLLRRTTF